MQITVVSSLPLLSLIKDVFCPQLRTQKSMTKQMSLW